MTTRWVESCLRSAGVLGEGRIAALSSRGNDAFNSSVVHLQIDYYADVGDDAPRALVLKRMAKGHGEIEVAFYRRVAPRVRAGLVPRCFDAAFEPESGNSHLLLLDLSDTHVPLVTRETLLEGTGATSARRMRAVTRSLAAIHASSWEHEAIGSGPPLEIRPWFRDASAFEAHVARRHRELDQAAHQLGADILEGYRRDLEALPGLWTQDLERRLATHRHLTVVQGDCYLTQWLAHRANEDEVVLVDFDSACAAPPTFDLVFLMTTFWPRAVRAKSEARALREYHEALDELGVRNYGWSHLLDDYRTMIALLRFDVIFDIANGSSSDYWRPKLTCLADAWDDWRDRPPPWVGRA